MGIDELIAASTVQFPMNIKLEELEQLFRYIVKSVPYDIPYRIEKSMTVRGDPERRNKYSVCTTSISVSGSVQTRNHDYASFKVIMDEQRPLLATSIKFDLIPGYTLLEHDAHYRNVWNLVQKQATNYFDEKH